MPEIPFIIDFSRTFIHFRSNRVNHTPRLQADASCTVRQPGVEARTFYLSCACLGENMYVARGLVQVPTCEFVLLAEPDREYGYIKKYASSDKDIRESHRVGEPMKTHSGIPATVLSLRVFPAHLASAHALTDYDGIRRAHEENRPVVGRTRYLAEDRSTEVVLEYPVKILNLAHDRPLWQVDTGPVLLPIEPLQVPKAGSPLASRLGLAYILYNGWGGAEVAIREETALGPPGNRALATQHYTGTRVLDARNELFAG
ncbi:MAG: hypothetical protein HYU36_15760 [Planctomycetes bacterium]|nr:hypothetical protein [Planctomycetota bacterium]